MPKSWQLFIQSTLMLIAILLAGCEDRYGGATNRMLNLSNEEMMSKLLPDQQKKGADLVKQGTTGALAEAEDTPDFLKTTPDDFPEFAPIIAPPEPPKLKSDRLVSLSITEDVPLKDVFIEIARLADLDIEIDPGINTGIIMRVKDQPLNTVIERIADLAALRYRLKNGVLRIERDLPYIEQYQVDFLNMTRATDTSINSKMSIGGGGGGGSSSGSAGGVGGGGGSGGGGGGSSSGNSSGSSSTITTNFSSNLWSEVESNISSILSNSQSASSSSAASPGGAVSSSPPAPAGAPPSSPSANKMGAAQGGSDNATFYAIHRSAGIITVKATERQHRDIAKYLNYVRATTSAQVLIEAKIVEVQLTDEYHSGINWGFLSQAGRNLGNFVGLPAGNSNAGGNGGLSMGVIRRLYGSVENNPSSGPPQNLQSILQLLSTFGNTTTLASPRVHAMNNQQAILSFVTNQVYFTLTVQPGQSSSTSATTGTTSGTTVLNPPTVNSTVNTVPIGVILSILPSINIETQEILMNVRPTLTRTSGAGTMDPALAYILQAQNIQNVSTLTSMIPTVNVREMDSIVKMRSGDIMVIGGMIDQSSSNTDRGVPGASRVPVIGTAFSTVDKVTTVTETVIFIKATIIESGAGTSTQDKKFYKDFTRDPKQFDFEASEAAMMQ